MKDYLGRKGRERWLGGEFYAATEADIGEAWEIGRRTAFNYVG